MARTMTKNANQFTVYFDGSCPLCQKEISFYRRRRGADRIRWQDVSKATNIADDLSCDLAMARFHIRHFDGKLIDGGQAFVELWKQLPAFRWLGLMCSNPVLRWVLDRAYNAFLPIRPRLQRFFVRRVGSQ